ncbi:MAG: hypothetical protein GX905_07360, partial [Bacteroidales bacterium]|nr:hypothetical protein [Bacteroidales bacterium]
MRKDIRTILLLSLFFSLFGNVALYAQEEKTLVKPYFEIAPLIDQTIEAAKEHKNAISEYTAEVY